MTAWSIRLYTVCDELLWAARLNLLWIAFTLLGGVVLGVGPATVAAYTLARRHAMGESFAVWTEFTAVYRREFVRGSLLVLPLAAAAIVLFGNFLYFTALGPGTAALRLTTYAALVALVVVAAYLLPMYVHYDLRPRAYLPKASLFALTRPASSLLLLFALAAVMFAASSLPILALTLAVGGWIQLNTWLCLRFFAENEARLHPKGD
ncbi:YesL family protein [Microbispora sp. NPDC049125]|uniref:YesL family protein n=1 Tax=Microbispora sp. NPDC049125 TaxID=3154929 RepID=UPI0034670177